MKHTSIRLKDRHVALINATGERPSTVVRKALDIYFQQGLDNEDNLSEVKRLISDQIDAHVRAHHFAHNVDSPPQSKNVVRSNVREDVRKNDDNQETCAPCGVREILEAIKTFHGKGIEPTVSDVAKSVGMNTRSMGVLLGKVGIHAKNTTRKSRVSRYFTFDMKEEIDRLLVEGL